MKDVQNLLVTPAPIDLEPLRAVSRFIVTQAIQQRQYSPNNR